MNIFQICAAASQRQEISLRDLQTLTDSLSDRDFEAVCDVLEKRTGRTWLTCDGSDVLFPDYQEAYLVGYADRHGEGPFLEDWISWQEEFVWAEDENGSEGYDRRAHCYWLEGRWWTDGAYREHFFLCDGCGGIYPNEDHAGDGMCSNCLGDDDDDTSYDHESPNGPVYRYSTDVLDVFAPRLETGVRYFGLEIEAEFADRFRAAAALSGFTDHSAVVEIPGLCRVAIWKTDGSVSKGLELVTIPLTLPQWREPQPVQALLDNQRFRKIARSHNTTTCGLHIHVTRNTVSEVTVAKLIHWFNEPDMLSLITLVARRAPNTAYCQAKKKAWHSNRNYGWLAAMGENDGSSPDPLAYARSARSIDKRQSSQHDRYTPINLTENTLEFRIFRGTLRWATVLASIEFCDAAITYAAQHGPRALNAADFTRWLQTSVTRKTYPALREYLERRLVLPARKPAPEVALQEGLDSGYIGVEATTAFFAERGVQVSQPDICRPVASVDALDPYAGNRTYYHNGHSGGTFHECPGDHFEIGSFFPARVRCADGRIIEVPVGTTWWNEARTSSLRVYL